MNSLYQTRLKRHLREMFKYLRLVFNDHFVFALLILIGGLGLAYSNALKTLTPQWWSRPVIIVALVVILQLGRLATLLQDADVVFLLPQERAMAAYFKRARYYSESLAMLIQLVLMFVLLPFVQVTMHVSALTIALLAIEQILLKDYFFAVQIVSRYQIKAAWWQHRAITNWLIPLLALVIGIYLSPFVAVIIALALTVVGNVMVVSHAKLPVNWWFAIASENNRMLGIYRFFNLFTNVPSLKGVAKRRRYLDWLLALIKVTYRNTYLYLYSRGVVRSGEFSGLYSRLTLLGLVLLYFIKGTWLPVLLAVLFIYLIGFQLIPFYWQFDDIVFTHLYPITQKDQIASFQRLLRWLLVLTAVVFLIMVAIINLNVAVIGALALVEIIEIIFLVQYYLPLRLRKNKR